MKFECVQDSNSNSPPSDDICFDSICKIASRYFKGGLRPLHKHNIVKLTMIKSADSFGETIIRTIV